MLMVSTDEVYGAGDAAVGCSTRMRPLRPASPYAASKAAADLLCAAWVATYAAPVDLGARHERFGPRQIERVVPTFAVNALRGRRCPCTTGGEQRREFLYVGDWVQAAIAALDRASPVSCTTSATATSSRTSSSRGASARSPAPPPTDQFVADRPGHDFRYGVRSDRCGRSAGCRRGPSTTPWRTRSSGTEPTRRARGRARRAGRDGAARPGRCRVRLLVTGAGGGLARAFLAQVPPHHDVHAFDRDGLDVGDHDAVRQVVEPLRARRRAELRRVHRASTTARPTRRALRDNALGPQHLALAARASGAVLLHVSTDYVFDGGKGAPYDETDEPRPLSVYGRAKLAGERFVREIAPASFVVRVGHVYGGGNDYLSRPCATRAW